MSPSDSEGNLSVRKLHERPISAPMIIQEQEEFDEADMFDATTATQSEKSSEELVVDTSGTTSATEGMDGAGAGGGGVRENTTDPVKSGTAPRTTKFQVSRFPFKSPTTLEEGPGEGEILACCY